MNRAFASLGIDAESSSGVCDKLEGIEPMLRDLPTTILIWSNGKADVFALAVIIHETMHSFGYEGNFDHYGTEQCNTRMAGGASGRPYNPDTWDLAEFQYYNGTCPDVYDNFVNSYQP